MAVSSAFSLTRLIVCVLPLLNLAFACTRPWQHAPQLHTLDRVHSNLTARWYRRPLSPPKFVYWTSPRIKWCVDAAVTGAARTTLTNAATNAWYLWKDHDVSNKISAFELKQGTDEECQPDKERLVFKTNNNKDFYTEGIKNAYITIDLDYANRHPLGLDGVVAHEIGHALGLLHEHQRPRVFGSPTDQNANPRVIFRCSALADWVQFGKPAAESPLCTSYSASSRAGFSAANFVPIQLGEGAGDLYSSAIDYDSIMFYSGQLAAAPLPGPGLRDIVLYDLTTQQAFKSNSVPSQGDLDGLVRLGNLYTACAARTGSKLKRQGASCSPPMNFDYGQPPEAIDCFVTGTSMLTTIK